MSPTGAGRQKILRSSSPVDVRTSEALVAPALPGGSPDVGHSETEYELRVCRSWLVVCRVAATSVVDGISLRAQHLGARLCSHRPPSSRWSDMNSCGPHRDTRSQLLRTASCRTISMRLFLESRLTRISGCSWQRSAADPRASAVCVCGSAVITTACSATTIRTNGSSRT
jgi:hypothetical protein